MRKEREGVGTFHTTFGKIQIDVLGRKMNSSIFFLFLLLLFPILKSKAVYPALVSFFPFHFSSVPNRVLRNI